MNQATQVHYKIYLIWRTESSKYNILDLMIKNVEHIRCTVIILGATYLHYQTFSIGKYDWT